MIKVLRKLVNEHTRATPIEYALIGSLIAVFLFTVVETEGTKVGAVLGDIGATLH